MAIKDGEEYRISATPAIILAHLLGIAAVTLVLVWILHFRDGLSLSSSNNNLQQLFNAHPFFMILGLIFLGGQAIMAYKTAPGSRRVRKFVHFALHLAAVAMGAVGLYAIFKFISELNGPDMISLHSWLGMGAISLYTLQLLVGFVAFLFPGAESTKRANYVAWHSFFGIVIFFLAIVTAETGLVQKFIFLGLVRGSEALVVNFIGLLIFLFGIAVLLTILLPRGQIQKYIFGWTRVGWDGIGMG